ncbi:MAG: hypothetical protein AW08_00402 [Candidatus Accumulibacter adjunctus]|uniref:Uncharacterized protein n=1 Tax=Candidatus Accumulibacter adjunctus TaxID=1454001 RepID=A0A011NX45_9PROT|nr:MAG: hypothetical protein AW08_00402 [Candidatus Accumulibacter adjunctus]
MAGDAGARLRVQRADGIGHAAGSARLDLAAVEFEGAADRGLILRLQFEQPARCDLDHAVERHCRHLLGRSELEVASIYLGPARFLARKNPADLTVADYGCCSPQHHPATGICNHLTPDKSEGARCVTVGHSLDRATRFYRENWRKQAVNL